MSNFSEKSEVGAEAFEVSPFKRLARAHGLSVAGDALLTIALADSLFFDVDPNDARWKVGLYLLLTLAPFTFVAPLLGPAMDRLKGGHRWMIVGSTLARAICLAALVFYFKTPVLFPLAFTMLVMGKTYSVAKSAVVPTTASDETQLVKYNSRLSIVSAVAGAAAGVPGVILLNLDFAGTPWVLGFGAVVHVAATAAALRIPAVRVADRPADSAEKAELKSSSIRLGAAAMGFLRGCVGFVTMLLAFSLRGGVDPGPQGSLVDFGHATRELLGEDRLVLATGGNPPWHFGVAIAAVGVGGLLGSVFSPMLRSFLKEEKILALALVVLAGLAALAGLVTNELIAACVIGFAISLVAQFGKQAFDALIQRDAPQANLGRTFSKFESRFQLVWVLGALLPVVLKLPARVGYFMILGGAALIASMYWLGRTPNLDLIQRDVEPRETRKEKSAAKELTKRVTEETQKVASAKEITEPAIRQIKTSEMPSVTGRDEKIITQELPEIP